MRRVIQIAAVGLALALSIPAFAGVTPGMEEADSILSRIESNVDDIRTQADRLMSLQPVP